jgi:16S rRNA (cytosine967-C5)-methyltransferase
MTPQARLQAAIEILDMVIVSTARNGAAADTLLAQWSKEHRYAGSGDRRAIRELVYRAIRAYGAPPSSGRAAFLGLGDDHIMLFDGSRFAPAVSDSQEPVAVPHPLPLWLAALIPQEEHEALLTRAPLDLRVNRLRVAYADVRAWLNTQSEVDETDYGLPQLMRLPTPLALDKSTEYQNGWFDMQDAGSQMVVAACAAKPDSLVIDLCAGAGGKSLALAAEVNNQARIIAADVNRTRLAQIAPRASRLGVTCMEPLLLNGGQEAEQLKVYHAQADVVLVDAPCSGSGTWRRNPEARWRLTPERLAHYTQLQQHVLSLAAPLVKPGGALVYAVCSLIAQEGVEQIETFLQAHPAFTPSPLPFGSEAGAGVLLTPSRQKTDGFFIARLIKC